MWYQVIYDTPEGIIEYCVAPMDYQTAEKMLSSFKEKYLDANGNGKRYPNGKGYYQVSNPRIIEATRPQ